MMKKDSAFFTPPEAVAYELPVFEAEAWVGSRAQIARATLDALRGEEVVVTMGDQYHCVPVRALSPRRYEVLEGALPSVVFLGEIRSIELVAPE